MAPRSTGLKDASNHAHKGETTYVHSGDRLGLGADAKNPSYIEDPEKIPAPGFLGIRWARTPGEIDNLNRLVDAKCKYFLGEHLRSGAPLPPEVDLVLKTNKPSTVYKERVTLIPLVFMVAHVANLFYQAFYHPFAVAAAGVFSWLYYDIYSGVLHIVHDNPIMMTMPVIGEPTLEFQWHHHIPQDLTSKSFLEVCGDLNVVTPLIKVLYFAPYPFFGFRNPMALILISWKLFFAFFGQLCHAMSHTPPHRRPKWVTKLQSAGVMVSPKEHWGHHKSYDDNYCIGSGIWNRALTPFLNFTNWVHKAIGSNDDISAYCWLAGFLAMSVFDVPLTNHLFVNVLKIGN